MQESDNESEEIAAKTVTKAQIEPKKRSFRKAKVTVEEKPEKNEEKTTNGHNCGKTTQITMGENEQIKVSFCCQLFVYLFYS